MDFSIPSIIKLSLQVSTFSVLIQIVPAVSFAWLLRASPFKIRVFLEILILLPLILTPIIIGYFILEIFQPNSFIGYWSRKLGIEVIFNWKGAVLAVSLISFPLFVQSVYIALTSIPERLEFISNSLGYNHIQTFFKITLPLSQHGILRGMILSFARGIGEFGATSVAVGSLPLKTETLPLAIYRAINTPNAEDTVKLLVLISIIFSLLFIGLLQCTELLKKTH